MRRFRLLLLPFGALAELAMLAVCWVLAAASPSTASVVMRWSVRRFPTLHWYIGE